MNILNYAKSIFDQEIEELIKIKNRMGKEIEEVVKLIYNTKGKVVITGVGKSGHIGKKLAATLASTGTLSIFMHAAEGLHGDLGMVHKNDLVIAISNSGNSDEVLSILPSIKKIGAGLVAMTGNKNSPLALESDVVIDIGVESEACPMNLAPTCSTTATLVMGDAIASTLIKVRDFKPENFALYHPGGSLGRRLLLKVKDLMHKKEKVAQGKKEDMVHDLVVKMTEKNLGAVCIMENEQVVGIVTEGDIRRALQNKEKFFEFKAEEVMTKNFIWVKEDVLAIDALDMMENKGVKVYQIPVLDEDKKLLGLIRLHDLVSIS
jgi:arabinose-5-phosphate isomerase